jgi:hypothetical protein
MKGSLEPPGWRRRIFVWGRPGDVILHASAPDHRAEAAWERMRRFQNRSGIGGDLGNLPIPGWATSRSRGR